MPSRAAYTPLAVARSDTGCSTVLIPWVEEPVMVTPEVVGHIDPCVSSAEWERVASAQLVDADQVARGIAEGAVANAVRLLGRLLDNLGAAGLQPREGA